jgi:hypothetical protein
MKGSMQADKAGPWLGAVVFELAALAFLYHGIKFGLMRRSVIIGRGPAKLSKRGAVIWGMACVVMGAFLIFVGWEFFITTSAHPFVRRG